MPGTNSGLGGFMSGGSIRFSKYKDGAGGIDAWRDQLAKSYASSASRGGARPRTTGTKLPKLNTVHSGTVVSVQPFGAFVQLGNGDTYKDGLLHVSCICATRVESPHEAGIEDGMKLWVKVYDVKDADGKYGLDIRYVSQRNGTDLDPYHGRGRIPDNFFEGGRVRQAPGKVEPPPAQQPEPRSGGGSGMPEPAVASRKRKARKSEDSVSGGGASGSGSGEEDPEERERVSKQLEKARKKLEKARREAEKAKKKLEKKAKKKKKKRRKEGDISDPCPSASSGSS